MKVVLTREVRQLGAPGDVVEVADGYARNFLLPRGLGVRATSGAMKQTEQIRRTREVREIRDKDRAQEIADGLAALRIRVPARAGEGGRLFGAVTHEAVAEAILKAGGPKVDRRRLQVEGPIKSLGAHRVSLRLHPEVEAEFTVEVVAG
ncbi:MAG: 50S ribosomal protein L9 [Acidobacteria bacterium]|nr:50S ribosomal protein L9 [Acidobacteriota bacterium]